jgi:integrase
MTRKLHKLTAKDVRDAAPKDGKKHLRLSDGGGLYLAVDSQGGRHWEFHFTCNGRARTMGLGPAAGPYAVTLTTARQRAADARKQLGQKLDPIAERDKGKVVPTTFGECVEDFLATKGRGWTNEHHKQDVARTLKEDAKSLHRLPVDEIDTKAVLKVIEPLWDTRQNTARRLRGRIEAVLNAATAKGHRSGDNPAAWAILEHLLSKPDKATAHHAALPYAEVPAFITELRRLDNVQAAALEFIILTATRLGEAREAKWSEFDLDARLWIIPAARMKMEREHRVPLSDAAMAVLDRMAANCKGAYVFPSRTAGLIGGATVLLLCEQKCTIHGFRSSFRDWCGEETNFPREVAEAALAHAVGNAVELAYRRGDALEKRRQLMDAWADFCGGAHQGADVVPMKRKG